MESIIVSPSRVVEAPLSLDEWISGGTCVHRFDRTTAGSLFGKVYCSGKVESMFDEIVVPVGLGALCVACLVGFIISLKKFIASRHQGTPDTIETPRTADEIAIGDAYREAESSWQLYRAKTGDTTEGLQLCGTPEKDSISGSWRIFFALYEPWVARNPPPEGMAWGASAAGPVLYKCRGELVQPESEI